MFNLMRFEIIFYLKFVEPANALQNEIEPYLKFKLLIANITVRTNTVSGQLNQHPEPVIIFTSSCRVNASFWLQHHFVCLLHWILKVFSILVYFIHRLHV